MQIKEDGRNPGVPASPLALYIDWTEPSSQNWNWVIKYRPRLIKMMP